jgi:hypothetical protein
VLQTSGSARKPRLQRKQQRGTQWWSGFLRRRSGARGAPRRHDTRPQPTVGIDNLWGLYSQLPAFQRSQEQLLCDELPFASLISVSRNRVRSRVRGQRYGHDVRRAFLKGSAMGVGANAVQTVQSTVHCLSGDIATTRGSLSFTRMAQSGPFGLFGLTKPSALHFICYRVGSIESPNGQMNV